jgi:gas vesicle protein
VNKILYFILGFVLGGVAGGVTGLLLTPMSGQRLRTEMDDYIHLVQQEVQQAADDRRKELERELAKLRGEVETE